jgi:parvulin-like peptidyl-prolyl isomerase
MKRWLLALCVVVLLGLVLSCSKTEEKAVASMGGQVLTVADIKAEYLSITKGSRPDLVAIEEKEQFVRDVLSKEIIETEARKIGLDKMPEVIEVGQNALRRQAWQVFYDDRIKSQVSVGDDDLRALHAKQRYRYHLAWIFVRSKVLAEELVARIKGGEDFGVLASRHSLDASRERAGDIGMRALGTMPEGVEDMIMAMSSGEVSDPIYYAGYYAIIKLHEKEQIEQQDFEAARSSLEVMARSRRENLLQREVLAQLQQKYGLAFNDDVIDMIAAETEALYPSETVEPGKVPEFSDEELARTVATYQGAEWRVRNYVERIKAQSDYLRPGYGTDSETIKAIIKDFIAGEIWFLEIRGEGYEEDPEVARQAERAFEEAIVTEMHTRLVADVTVDEDKLREFYSEKTDELVTEPGARLAVITLETEADAEEVYRELQAGGSFSGLARAKSIDRVTGDNDGELRRPLYRSQIEQFPEIEDLVNQLSEGSYSRPIPTPPGFGPEGYILVKVVEKIEARQMDFEEVRDMIGQRVLQLEQDRVFGEWLREKMEEYAVEIYPDALGRIDFSEIKDQEA